MIRIDIARNRLTVGTDGQDVILSGTHRAYFETILNFRRTPDAQGYEWAQLGRVGEQLREVCDYLDEHSLAYQLEEEAARMLARVRGAEARLATAIAAGREVQERANIDPPAVAGLKRPLLPHQWRPVHHLLQVPNAANFSVPGAGKTAMVLAAFQGLKAQGVVDCLVVVGPGSSFLAWEEELQEALENPGTVVRLSGSPEERLVAYQRAREADLILVTYNTANNDEERLIEFLRTRKCLLVLDESHYVKGSGAFADAVLALAPEAERRIILTGTPMPNGFPDLWTQTAFLWPEEHLFGNRMQFRNLVGNIDGQNSAKAKVRPLFTRVRKSDLHLPEQRYKRIPVSMGPIQQRIYAALAARTLNEVSLIPTERIVLREWRKAKMVRLLQAASNPALLAQESIEFSVPPEDSLDKPLLELVASYLKYEMPHKILAADKLVRKILEDSGEKVVLWTHFVRNIELLMELLKDFGAVALYGAIPREGPDEESETRERNIRAFREDRHTRVVVANPGAAAESISLHKVSHHAIYLDRTFNAGQFIQSRDRIHRVGLQPEEHVTYHLLVSAESIDEVVDARLLAKEQRMAELLEDPDLPTVGVQIATDHLSGPDETEEELDFDAVLEDIRQRLERRRGE